MLLAIDLLAAAGLAAWFCVLTGLRNPVLIPLFLVFWLVTAVLLVGVYLVAVFLCTLPVDPAPEKRKKHPILDRLLRSTMYSVCLGGRVKLRVCGEEKLPDEPFLLVSNHRSMLDVVVTTGALRKRVFAFIAKPEILHAPIIGRIARCCNYMEIDRSNPRNAIRTVNRASEVLRDGVSSVAVYPEGTRNRKREQQLLPFHDGVLMIAQKAKAPIAVVALEGTEQIVRRFPWRSTVVRITVCDVIPAETVAVARTGELSERAREAMLRVLEHSAD